MMKNTIKIAYKGKCTNLITTSVKIKQYYLNGEYSENTITNVLVDCGSTVTIATKETFQKLQFITERIQEIHLSNAVNQNMSSIKTSCKCNIIVNNIEITNCEVLLLETRNMIKYNMILGWDVLREIMMENGVNIFESNNIQRGYNFKISQNENDKYRLFENTQLHAYCNLECESKCEEEKKCSHEKFEAKRRLHFKTRRRIFIPENTTEVIEVYTEEKEKLNFDRMKFYINWEYRTHLKYEGFTQNSMAGNTIFIRITNKDLKIPIIIEQDVIILCAEKTEENTAFFELNHLVEFEELTSDEKKFHQNEYNEWKEKRNKCVKETDIKQQIKSAAEKAKRFQKELEKMLKENDWVFSRNNADIGLTTKYVCELEWKNTYNGEVINRKPYKMDPELELEVEEVLNDMMNNQVIETCNSSFNTALLAVRKPNGQIRLVQDYSRTINPHINLPNFPIANSRRTLNEISEHISKIKNIYREETLISSLDLKSGFHIIPMRKNHRPYLAFKHKNKQFTWKRMAMGPKNSPSDFCCMMDRVLGNLDTQKTKIIVYVDDILIISAKSDAIRALKDVLEALSEENMFVSLKKCEFFQHEVTFLGYKINQEGFTALTNKLQKLADFPMPENLKQAYTFAGICTYYTRYVPQLQILLSPLHKAIAKEGKFKMTEEAIMGIKEIQNKAKLGFHLEHIDWEKPVFVCADTSLVGIGACLGNCTREEDQLTDIKVVAYASRGLDLQEALLSSKARECIGASWALETFSDLLHKNQPCLLITDHLSMTSIFQGNPLTNRTSIFTRYRRALAILLEYDIEFIHLPNKHELIQVADGLSRSVEYEKKPLRIKESELGLSIQIEQDITNPREVNNAEIELPIIPTDPLYTREDLLRAQDEDEEINRMKEKLKNMNENEVMIQNRNEYILKNELVHRINPKGIPEILIPEKDTYHIIQFIHHTRDHAAVDRLVYYINRLNIHVKSKYKMVKKVVQECFLCQLSKPSNEGKDRIKYSLRPAIEPFRSIRADLLDFTSANQDFKYILTMMDTFSLYLESYFLTDKKATTVAREMALYAMKYGLSGRSEITTDSGTEFDNKNLEKELEALNITKLKISGYNPCSNRVERAHQEIKRLLRTQLHKRNWDMRFKIEIAVSKYNNQESKYLGYKTPFYTIFGFEADFLSSVFTIKEQEEETFNPKEEEIDEKINKWVEYRNKAILDIGKQRWESNTCKYEELETRIDVIRVNDIVAVKFAQKPGTCGKFHFEWRAPFLVKSMNLGSVRIECLHTRALFTRNIRLVKKLRLEPSFEKTLRERNFVCRENFFYPLADEEREDELKTEEIMEESRQEVKRYNLRKRVT